MLLAWGICRNEDLRPAVVVGLLHNSLKISLTEDDWFSGWRSWLASLILNWCLTFTHHMCDVCSDIFADKVLKKTLLDLQKRFPMYHVCPKCLAARFCGSAFPENGWAFHQNLDEVGKNTGWLAGTVGYSTACWFSIFKISRIIIQLISFCNSCILPVSSRIVSRSSTNFLLTIVSNVEPWNRFNSSITFSLFSRASRRSQFCSKTVHEEVDDLVEVVRLLDEHDKFLLFETWSFHSTFEYFFGHNRPGIRAFESPLDIQRESALCVVPEESWFAHFLSCGADFLWRLEFVSQTVPQQVAPFYDRQTTTTDWTTNLRHESDKLVCGSHHLLAPGWTVVKRAPCRWWRHRSRSHSGTAARPRIPGCRVQWPPWCGSRWAHNLWEGRSRQGCQGPHQRVCTGNLPTTSWKMKLMGKKKNRLIRRKMVSRERKVE